MYSTPDKKSNEFALTFSEVDSDSSIFLTPIKHKKDDYINGMSVNRHNNTNPTEKMIDDIYISEELKIPELSYDKENRDVYFSRTNENNKFYCSLKKGNNRKKTLDIFRAYNGIDSTALNLNNEFVQICPLSPITSCDSLSSLEFENNVSNNQYSFQTPKCGSTTIKRKNIIPLAKRKKPSFFNDKPIPSDLLLPTF